MDFSTPPIPKPIPVKKRETPERDIESQACDYARHLDCYVRKFTSPNHRSVPDRLFIAENGRVFFIEFKAPGKKPTASQEREIERLRLRHQHVYIHDNLDEAKAIIDVETSSEPMLHVTESEMKEHLRRAGEQLTEQIIADVAHVLSHILPADEIESFVISLKQGLEVERLKYSG